MLVLLGIAKKQKRKKESLGEFEPCHILNSSSVHGVQNQVRLLSVCPELSGNMFHKYVCMPKACVCPKRKKRAIKYVISHCTVTGEIDLHRLISKHLNGKQRRVIITANVTHSPVQQWMYVHAFFLCTVTISVDLLQKRLHHKKTYSVIDSRCELVRKDEQTHSRNQMRHESRGLVTPPTPTTNPVPTSLPLVTHIQAGRERHNVSSKRRRWVRINGLLF